ncbi:MAG: hypothetical protein ACRDT4_12690 [Micromonosporaceae bacterium]
MVTRADPHRRAEAFPRRPSPRSQVSETPSTKEIDAARHAYLQHIPSMFTHQCLACDGTWPCLPYRMALCRLQTAGLPLEPRENADR